MGSSLPTLPVPTAVMCNTLDRSEPFDWYHQPKFYDAIFEEDTPIEANMLRSMVKRFLPRSASESSVIPLACLEPACGSARLMLALSEWIQVGFDLSSGAMEFAHGRWKEMEAQRQLIQRTRREKLAEEDQNEVITVTQPIEGSGTNIAHVHQTSPASSSTIHPFIVFQANMIDFSEEIALAAPTISRFDLAHCLVSSLKHLLLWEDVSSHFQCVHRVMQTDGIYIIALHIHTMDGEDHFDRKATYGDRTTNAQADSSEQVESSGLPAAISPNEFDPTDVDDAFDREYARDGMKFHAELITYAPNPTTMIEKMIARVNLHDSSAAGSSSSPTSPSLQTDMNLRVYTLSTVHSLLCSIAPMFSLAGVYSYADIYCDEWNVDEFEITWPFPKPDLSQLQQQQPADSPLLHHPYILSESDARRNWNRVHPRVSKELREEWDGVEAIVLVLKKAPEE